MAFFAANQTYSSTETATRYSSLSTVGREQVVVDAIKSQFSNVQSISIELTSGMPLLFARVDGFVQKLPINMLSGGMSKLAAILFAIPTTAKGIVLIDELENGFYYKRFPSIWKTLLFLCEEYNVQLFVSTHSAECLDAAATVARDNPGKFSVVRTTRNGRECQVKQFDGERFSSAIESNVEIR